MIDGKEGLDSTLGVDIRNDPVIITRYSFLLRPPSSPSAERDA